MKAIAAMAQNRVIGRAGTIPWHLPEDFRWFKRTTTGGVVLMGRKTFASLGKPLPDRVNVVVTRGESIPGVETVRDLAEFDPARYAPREVWLIGGAELYRQLLPRCSDLYLTLVRREVEGDAYFPPFEDDFEWRGIPFATPDLEVHHYTRKAPDASAWNLQAKQ
jgi:dihydrofolate reductase